MHIHFIAIGGSAMHNLAIALKDKGYHVTGSDDEIFEPSKSRLLKKGILPNDTGWFPEKITPNTEAVILGMHAHADNPELAKAKDLGIRIYSYPEYLYEQTKDKIRVVIGGSHGKTTTTAMILHVLNELNRPSDYMVGAQLAGYDCMVGLTKDRKIAVLEGDEYLSSPIDRRSKFHLYYPQVAMLTGIAWDHINVFPTFEGYVEQFDIFAKTIQDGGQLIYYAGDEHLVQIAKNHEQRIQCIPYDTHPHEVRNGTTFLKTNEGDVELAIFGKHNLQNLNGARLVCNQIGVSDTDFYRVIGTFTGASKRLEKLSENDHSVIFRDFAHSPSKLKATTAALKEQYPDRLLIACMELHTYSSLKAEFLNEYKDAMKMADVRLVSYSPETVKLKRLTPISAENIKQGFNDNDLLVVNAADEIMKLIRDQDWSNANLLLMSSGHFGGLDLDEVVNVVNGS